MWSLMLIGTGHIQVLYLGKAPSTKDTLPDFREKCRVTRHSRVFHGLTGSQRTPGIRASQVVSSQYNDLIFFIVMRHLFVFWRFKRAKYI